MRKSPNPVCAIADCARPTKARNYCALHYRRFRNHGDPMVVLVPQEHRQYEREPEAARFWSKVDKGGPASSYAPDLGPCWLWIGAKSDTGYGSFNKAPEVRGGRFTRTNSHRYSYESLVGPIPSGLHLDHLCRVRHCVNPTHLEPVTNAVNSARGAQARRALAHSDCGVEDCGERRCQDCDERMTCTGPEPRACGVSCCDCRCDCTACLQARDEMRADLQHRMKGEGS